MESSMTILALIGFNRYLFLSYLKKRASPLMILSRKCIAGEAQVELLFSNNLNNLLRLRVK